MLLATSVVAQAETLKIGFLTTLSGPLAALGQHSRDGFLLAVKQRGGKLGGVDAEVIVKDDSVKPDVALLRTQQFIERDKVDVIVGMLTSNVLQAAFQPVTESRTLLIGVNAGTSMFAGEKCNPFFFSTSWENNQVPEAIGKHAQDSGYRRIVTLVPNYQGGRDATAGFKHHFKGEVLDEIYVKQNQLDFAAELTRIRALKPDAVLVFMPGGTGVSLARQYAQSGLASSIPFLSVWTLDETTLPAIQDAAVGLYGSSHWAPDLDNAVNAAFVKAFEAEYGYVPSNFAAQAYDAGLLIDLRSRQPVPRSRTRGPAQGPARCRLRLDARALPLQHEPVSDPGFLAGSGYPARGRQIRDLGKAEDLRRLCRPSGPEVPDVGVVLQFSGASQSSDCPCGPVHAFGSPSTAKRNRQCGAG